MMKHIDTYKLFEAHEDDSFFARLELFGSEYDLYFSFSVWDIPIEKADECINEYKKWSSNQWVGGPVSHVFVDWWNRKYSMFYNINGEFAKETLAGLKAYKPVIKMVIHTDSVGDLKIGYNILTKKACSIDYGSMVDTVDSNPVFQWANSNIYMKGISYDETLKLLNIKKKFDW